MSDAGSANLATTAAPILAPVEPLLPLTRPACLYCFAPLLNGRDFCDDACEDGQWAIVPTIDGEIYEPDEPEEPPPSSYEFGMPPIRPALEAPPEPHEAATFRDRMYLDAARLRRNLIAAGL